MISVVFLNLITGTKTKAQNLRFYHSLKDKNTRFYSQFLQCAGTNFGKSVLIWLNGYSFVNTPLPHFPVSIIPAYRKLFKGFLLLTSKVLLLDGLQILNFLSN